MESQRRKQNVLCEFCDIEFSSSSTRNRHLRKFHPESTEQEQIKHIMCPLCTDIEKFNYYNYLNKHLFDIHHITVKESVLNFRNFEEFTSWRAQENREVNYASQSRKKFKNGEEHMFYNCNRSDIKGFSSSCKVRKMKSGGSIRIRGTCPSRIRAKVSKNGSVQVNFFETHVGHADERITNRLSKAEKNIEAHKKAENMNGMVEFLEFGKYKVQSSVSDKCYVVSCNKVCDLQCRIGYCNKCKICSHRYQCHCPENAVKTVLCKHIHAVALFEERSESVLGSLNTVEDDDDVTHSIQESSKIEVNNSIMNFEEMREIELQEICSFVRSLDENSLNRFMADFRKCRDRMVLEQKNCQGIKKKRKIEK